MKDFLTPNAFKVVTVVFLGIYIFFSALSYNDRHDSPASISLPGVILSTPFYIISNNFFTSESYVTDFDFDREEVFQEVLQVNPSTSGYVLGFIVEILLVYLVACLVALIKDRLGWENVKVNKVSKYVSATILAVILLATTALFIPPAWAMCECTYNEIKSFLIFPMSLFAGIMVVLIAYIFAKRGCRFWKTFSIILVLFVLAFGALGLAVYPISEYIDANNIPIFQPDFHSYPVTIPTLD